MKKITAIEAGFLVVATATANLAGVAAAALVAFGVSSPVWGRPVPPTAYGVATASGARLQRQPPAAFPKLATALRARRDPPMAGAGRRIGLYQSQAGGWPVSIGTALAARLRGAGFTVRRLSNAQLADPALLRRKVLPALVLVDSAVVPADAVKAIGGYYRSGGFLVSLGGPAFSHPLFKIGNAWLSRFECRRKVLNMMPAHALALPRRAGEWKEQTNVPYSPKITHQPSSFRHFRSRRTAMAPYTVRVMTRRQALPKGVSRGWRFDFSLSGWDRFNDWRLFTSPSVTVPAEDKLTVFWAKGGKTARQLDVEWRERNGSLWIAVVALRRHWTRYVLPEGAFVAYPQPPAPGARLQLHQADGISFGLVNTWNLEEGNGSRYAIAIAGVETVALPKKLAAELDGALQPRINAALDEPFHGAVPPAYGAFPAIDTISPPFRVFPVTNMCTLAVNPRQAIAPIVVLPRPAATLGVYPRAQATSLNRHIATRFVPLLNCYNKHGHFAATAAALILPTATASHRQATSANISTAWAQSQAYASLAASSPPQATTLSIPVTDPAFFTAAATQRWLVAIVKRVSRGLYLESGGAGQYACFSHSSIRVGALVANHGLAPQTVRVISDVTGSGGKSAFRHVFTATVDAGATREFATTWTPRSPNDWENVYHVTTSLETEQSKIVDRLDGSLRVLGSERHPHFVTSKNGLFYLRGKPWYVYGVNFHPETSIAAPGDYPWREFWLTRPLFAPRAVERELRQVKKIGLNEIAIAAESEYPWNLLDVLAMCRQLGLKVNLSSNNINGLEGGLVLPRKFQMARVRQLISKLRLASNDAVFADWVCAGAMWSNQANRRRVDPQWRAWINSHYGSIKKAEADWHFRAPRWHGQVTNPPGALIAAGRRGPAAAMVRAYNRFLNGLLARYYGAITRSIRRVYPHHLVSLTISRAGDPVYPGDVYYDFAGLAHVVDILEPVGYGYRSRSSVKQAIFTIQYARAIAPKLPFVFAEFGKNIWSQPLGADTRVQASIEARLYKRFLSTILTTDANGVQFWWFPGGYRTGENSDFGIINPDGSWRPVTYVIHGFAARLKAPRPLRTPGVWIPVRRDYLRGVRGAYLSVKKEFQAALRAGKLPGFKIVK